MASWTSDDVPSSGNGAGTGDHRDLTHRNDANQHTGDAVKVTTTWPGDSEPSDKTLTEGIAAVIAKIALVAADIPNLSASQITSGTVAQARLGTGSGGQLDGLRRGDPVPGVRAPDLMVATS